MPWALGIWAFVGGSRFWLRWVVPECGHAESRRVVPGAAGSTGRRVSVGPGCECSCWSGRVVGHGYDGCGGAGDGVRAAGVREGAGAFRLAGTVPVPAGDGPVFPDCAGQRGVGRSPGADGGEDRAAAAGAGDLAGLDGLPGAASLLCGNGGEGGVAGDAAGHLDSGSPGGEFSRQCRRSVTRQNISGTSWPSTVTQYSMARTVTVTPSPHSSAR